MRNAVRPALAWYQFPEVVLAVPLAMGVFVKGCRDSCLVELMDLHHSRVQRPMNFWQAVQGDLLCMLAPLKLFF